MGRIPDEIVERIIASADIVNVVGKVVELKKSGNNYTGICPFHQEKTPSLVVSPQKQIFHCFGCSKGGNSVKFVMETRNLNFPEALRSMADELGIIIQESKEDKLTFLKRKRLLKINEIAKKIFSKNLYLSPLANKYLKNREIPFEVINKFQIGYAQNSWDSLYQEMKKNNVNVDDLLEVGLISKTKDGKIIDRFRNRLMFPIFDNAGQVIGFGGRTLGDDKAKYINSQESMIYHKGRNLFALNFQEIVKHEIILVEGYMDVISMFAKGLPICIASLGTALTPDQANLIKKLRKDVYICYDGDTAGIQATQRAVKVFEEVGLVPRIISLPNEQDPDDYIKVNGKDAFIKLMENSNTPIDYRLVQNLAGININTHEGRILYIEKAIETISTIKRKLIKDEYIRKVALELEIDEKELAKEVEKRSLSKNQYITKPQNTPINPNLANKIKKINSKYNFDLDLIKCSMENIEFYEILKKYFTEDYVNDKLVLKMGIYLGTEYSKDQKYVTISRLVNDFRTKPEYDSILLSLNEKIKKEGNIGKVAVEELCIRLDIKYLDKEKNKIISEIELLSDMDRDDSINDRISELFEKMSEIDKQIKKKL